MANNSLPDEGVSRPVSDDINRLRAAATAIRNLPELLKPYTVEGTKLRLPKEIGDELHDGKIDGLKRILDSVHYEGVHYEYQDEAGDDLKARVEALGYALYVTDNGGQLVVDHYPDSDRTPEVVFIHTEDGDDDLEDWIADREQVSARVRRTVGPNEAFAASVSDRIDALDSAREAAHEAVYEIRGLIGAAELLAEEGTGDERLQVLLRISLGKLKALSEALDIVNFGKVRS